MNETDLELPSSGFPLVFSRTYNSREPRTNSLLGFGWTHGYDLFLSDRSNTTYKGTHGNWKVLLLGDGNQYWFRALTNGAFASPAGKALRLQKEGSNYWVTADGYSHSVFSTNGVLEALTDAFGNRLSFSYEGRHPTQKLSRIEDNRGNYLRCSNVNGRLVKLSTSTNTLYATYSYNANGELTNVTRYASGKSESTAYTWDAGAHSLRQKRNALGHTYRYDYEYYYNDQGQYVSRATNMVLQTNYYSHSVNYTNQGMGLNEVVYKRGADRQKWLYEFDPTTAKITAKYMPERNNSGTYYSFDNAQNVTNETLVDYLTGHALYSVRTFDEQHHVTGTAFGYDQRPAETDWRMVWNTNDQTLTETRDPAGHVVSFVYTNGLVAVTREHYNSNQWEETRFSYTSDGLLCALTNANGSWVQYLYNSSGLMTSEIPAAGPQVNYAYGSLGYLQQIRLPGPSGDRVTYIESDDVGRALRMIYPDNRDERFEYDVLGNLTNSIDRAGRATRLTYAPTRKLASVSRLLDGEEVTTRFDYDNQFNTLKIVDPLGRAVETYGLDMLDRPVVVTNLEGQTLSIAYQVGNYVDRITRFDGTVVSNAYDAKGRLSRLTYPGGFIANTYLADGRLATISDGTGTISNAYDALNRLACIVGATPSSRVEYAYYPAGQVSNVTSVAGAVRYGLDAADRLTYIQTPQDRFEFGYDAYNGVVAQWASTNSGLAFSAQYDVLDRITNMGWSHPTAGLLRTFRYAYDASGLITQKTVMGAAAENTAYAYDDLGRLVSESVGAARTEYRYDQAGNRTAVIANGQTNTYILGIGNRLANWGTNSSAQYDAAGNATNMIFDDGRTLSMNWDGLYRLTSVSTNGAWAESYSYDALGNRVQIANAEGTTYLVYDGLNVIAETDAAGKLLKSYTHGPGIDNILSMSIYTGAQPMVYYYIKDHLGSVLALADTNGNIVESYSYTAWGEVNVFDSEGRPIPRSTIGNRYLWQGREYSWKTGFYFFRARSYCPGIGRWLSTDPGGISFGLNQFLFCENDPINYRDPFGLFSWSAFGKGVAKAVVGVAIGVAVGAVIVATAPAAVVVAAGIAAAGVGGFATGQAIYEGASGKEWSVSGNGAELTDYARSESIGNAVVGVVSLATLASSWGRAGAEKDLDWLKMSPKERMAYDNDLKMLNDAKFGEIKNIPPGSRGLRISDQSVSAQAFKDGLSSASRGAFSYASAGSGLAGSDSSECGE
ncbi:MAG TPA: hypothetical protein DCZ95_01900 [Verrucomicrobia bacterium]|nr:hypothetical protein [Verrucomicrobiota bacterium]